MKVFSLKQKKTFENPLQNKSKPSSKLVETKPANAPSIERLEAVAQAAEILPTKAELEIVKAPVEATTTQPMAKPSLRTINVVSAVCGGGKTLGLLAYLIQLAKNTKEPQKVLIIVANKENGNNICRELRANNIQAKTEFSEDGKILIAQKISNAVGTETKTVFGSNMKVIIVTQQGFEKLPAKNEWKMFDAIQDELPNTIEWCSNPIDIGLEDSKVWLDKIFPEFKAVGDLPRKVVFDPKEMDLRFKRKDTLAESEAFKKLRSLVKANRYEFFACKWEDRLQVRAELKASFYDQFKSFTVMGAYASGSGFFSFMERQGVQFLPHEGITKARFYDRQKGELLPPLRTEYPLEITKNIRVFFAEDHFKLKDETYRSTRNSKAKMQSKMELVEEVIRKAIVLFKNEPFIYSYNGTDKLSPNIKKLLAKSGGLEISAKSQGSNEYSEYNHYLHLVAMNEDSRTTNFLNAFSNEIERYFRNTAYHAYQNASRLGYRNFKADGSEYCIICLDRTCAEYIHEALPGSTLENINGDPVLKIEPTPLGVGFELTKNQIDSWNKFLTTSPNGIQKKDGGIQFGINSIGKKEKLMQLIEAWPYLSKFTKSKFNLKFLKNVNKDRIKLSEEEQELVNSLTK